MKLSYPLALISTASVALGQTDFSGRYTRTFVSPNVCNAPGDCNYECSRGYIIVGSQVTSTYNGNECLCGSGSIDSNGSGQIGGSPITARKTETGVTVSATVNGIQCAGTYSNSNGSSVVVPVGLTMM
eukprot:Awhi_evm1s14277